MPRSAIFYFGTVLFFVGLLLFAASIAAIIDQVFTVLTFAELISGLIMMGIGYRATRPTMQRAPS